MWGRLPGGEPASMPAYVFVSEVVMEMQYYTPL
jgi:hypothetical protein